MKFGSLHLDNAVGAILAHGVSYTWGTFKKGRVLSVADVKLLQAAGHESVTAAVLDADDVTEDEAARQIALAVCGDGAAAQQAFTGRANLYSSVHGVLDIDEARIKALNCIDESLTIATLPKFATVNPKQMLATIKIIPFAISRRVLDLAIDIAEGRPLVRVAAFRPMKAGLVITRVSQTKASVVAKAEQVTRDRLAALRSELGRVIVCDHNETEVAEAITTLGDCDLVLLFGASAIVDRQDVIPSALESAGGVVLHLGMPVDPGNLLMLGKRAAATVIGVPSCARSPKENGFDWVLERVCAGIDVTPADIMDMGAGGLLAEIPSRPQPREGITQRAPRIAAIVLAAGTSSRMGANKMLADFRGMPMLRATLLQIAASAVDEIVVVTGHESGKVEAIIAGLRARVVHNPHFAEGLSTSVRCGIEAVADDVDAVVVCLGDMPLIEAGLIDRMTAAFNPAEHRALVIPVFDGDIGNPVLWGKEYFVKLMALEGDRGARGLVERLRSEAVEVEAVSDAIFRDADTPEALAGLQG